MLKLEILKDLLKEYKDVPSLTLAKAICKLHPDYFDSIDAARTMIRYYRGSTGIYARNIVTDKRFLAPTVKRTVTQEQIDQSKETQPYKAKQTYVYVMVDLSTKYYKIGISVDVTRRERTLQSEKPTIILIFQSSGTRQDEKHLHRLFNDQRIRGEWFDLSSSDLETIKNYFNDTMQ